MTNYILDKSGSPVVEPDILKWAVWFETADRKVARDMIGKVRISTVFLGVDHSYGSGSPLIYETMIFGGKHDEHQLRTGNRVAAMAAHDQAVSLVQDPSAKAEGNA